MVGHADACWILPPGRPRCRAYVCIPIEDSLARRSPVIETLMEIEGIAELPDGVPVADFLSWSSMATDELSAFHADDVCQALRVSLAPNGCVCWRYHSCRSSSMSLW